RENHSGDGTFARPVLRIRLFHLITATCNWSPGPMASSSSHAVALASGGASSPPTSRFSRFRRRLCE
ncbi:MAG: hypothetical protein M3450_18900, partial [Actinomycetota bacterium]|nr:hypothetical protein [Actinomycetota bacterium]